MQEAYSVICPTCQFFNVDKWTITPFNIVLKYSELAGPALPMAVSPPQRRFSLQQQQQQGWIGLA